MRVLPILISTLALYYYTRQPPPPPPIVATPTKRIMSERLVVPIESNNEQTEGFYSSRYKRHLNSTLQAERMEGTSWEGARRYSAILSASPAGGGLLGYGWAGTQQMGAPRLQRVTAFEKRDF